MFLVSSFVEFGVNVRSYGGSFCINNVDVVFSISVFNEDIAETLEATYPVSGGQEPEYDIAEFYFYPNYESIPHDQYDNTEISVIAKNDAGVGISNVLVRFALDAESRGSNGEISHEFEYTCCENSDSDSTVVELSLIHI